MNARRPTSVTDDAPMLTPDQVADRLQVSRSTVDRLIAAGRIRAVVIPGAGRGIRRIRRVTEDELRAFQASLRGGRVA